MDFIETHHNSTSDAQDKTRTYNISVWSKNVLTSFNEFNEFFNEFNLMNLMNLMKYIAESHRLIAMYRYIHILQWQHEMYIIMLYICTI